MGSEAIPPVAKAILRLATASSEMPLVSEADYLIAPFLGVMEVASPRAPFPLRSTLRLLAQSTPRLLAQLPTDMEALMAMLEILIANDVAIPLLVDPMATAAPLPLAGAIKLPLSIVVMVSLVDDYANPVPLTGALPRLQVIVRNRRVASPANDVEIILPPPVLKTPMDPILALDRLLATP